MTLPLEQSMEREMSNRTIIEINHDYSHEMDRRRFDFMNALGEVLRDSSSESGWAALAQFGVLKYVTAHHSDDRKVVLNGIDYGAQSPNGEARSSVGKG